MFYLRHYHWCVWESAAAQSIIISTIQYARSNIKFNGKNHLQPLFGRDRTQNHIVLNGLNERKGMTEGCSRSYLPRVLVAPKFIQMATNLSSNLGICVARES
jgi:hypothetical protein